MLTPIFTHGTLENTIEAIAEGKIKYPGYCWCWDTDQYGFINKQNQLDLIGIPTLVGTQDHIVVLSSLADGIYQVRGLHKVTATHSETYDSESNILVVVQTIGETKKVRRITSDELTAYTIEEDLSVIEDEVITQQYLYDNEYITAEDLENELVIFKEEIMEEFESIIDPIVRNIIDEEITPISEQHIDALFG